MEDYSKEDWYKYIKSHMDEFDVQTTGPDNFNLWRVDIMSRKNSHYSEYYEDTNKNVALEHAINRLIGVLYQYHKTPGNL